MSDWFDIDKNGLAKLLERRGKVFALFELISNAWDSEATEVNITFEPIAGYPKATLIVEDDDPDGFTDLAHAYTMFAESTKKGLAKKRGRFNMGEKLVLAVCDSASISSTTGTIVFDITGRKRTKVKREKGSRFEGVIRMTRAEYDEALAALKNLLPPAIVKTTVNGEELLYRKPLVVFEATLPTEIAGEDGMLRRSKSKAEVHLYQPNPGETATLYELGVPVVETGDKYHVEIHQKVPLNMDRDNVPPAFLKEIRTLVLNHTFSTLPPEDANELWVRQATSSKDCAPEATEAVLTLRFGEKRVAYDPSDVEANNMAVAQGYTVVHGGMLHATEWQNAKAAAAILPAGQVTPSPKPYSPDGKPLNLIAEPEWTADMTRVADYARALGPKLLNRTIEVQIADEAKWPFAATYGNGQLTFNAARVGADFFKGPLRHVDRLLIHEFGHEAESNHLSHDFHEALCELGARLADLARSDPSFFTPFIPEGMES